MQAVASHPQILTHCSKVLSLNLLAALSDVIKANKEHFRVKGLIDKQGVHLNHLISLENYARSVYLISKIVSKETKTRNRVLFLLHLFSS